MVNLAGGPQLLWLMGYAEVSGSGEQNVTSG
jgi:hypothetical protein